MAGALPLGTRAPQKEKAADKPNSQKPFGSRLFFRREYHSNESIAHEKTKKLGLTSSKQKWKIYCLNRAKPMGGAAHSNSGGPQGIYVQVQPVVTGLLHRQACPCGRWLRRDGSKNARRPSFKARPQQGETPGVRAVLAWEETRRVY